MSGWARRLGMVALVLLAALGLLGGMGTYAFWNDTASVSGTTVTSGTLDLKVGGADSYTWSALSVANLAPGESWAATLTVSNAGTTPFTVSADGTASGTLAGYLTVVVKTGGTATTSSTYPRSGSCSGTQTWTGTLTSSATTVLGPTASITSGGTLSVCVAITLSASTPNGQQGQSTGPAFTFTATQAAS